MNKLFLSFLVISLFFLACEEKKSSETEDNLGPYISYTKAEKALTFNITGKIICPACKSEDVVMLDMEDENGNHLIYSPDYTQDFGQGDFKIMGIWLMPETKIMLRVSIGSVNPLGYENTINVPKDNSDPNIEVIVKAL